MDQQMIRGDRELDNILLELNYPASREYVMREIGNIELQWTRTEPITLNDVLIEIHADEYQTMSDLKEGLLSIIHLSYGDHGVEREEAIISP